MRLAQHICELPVPEASHLARRFSAGKFDNEDVKLLVSRATGVLGDGLPSVGGFIAGLHTGLSFF